MVLSVDHRQIGDVRLEIRVKKWLWMMSLKQS